MVGTQVEDASAVSLHSGTIASATTTTGTAKDVQYPGWVRVEAVIGDITGTGVTADIEIQASNDSTFTVGVEKPLRLRQANMTAGNEQISLWGNCYVNKRYMRAVIITAGTVTAVPITNIWVRPAHFRRTATDV